MRSESDSIELCGLWESLLSHQCAISCSWSIGVDFGVIFWDLDIYCNILDVLLNRCDLFLVNLYDSIC